MANAIIAKIFFIVLDVYFINYYDLSTEFLTYFVLERTAYG